MMTKPCYLLADNMCCGALRCGEVCMAATSGKWPEVVGCVREEGTVFSRPLSDREIKLSGK